MQKRILVCLVAALLTATGAVSWAQTYSNAVMALNPAGYWPLNETAQPPMPVNLTATNAGSLGAAGNGYYGAWYQPSGAAWYLEDNVTIGAGPITGGVGDQALDCPFSTGGQYIVLPRNTNGVANSAITIKPPFSIEAWVNVSNLNNSAMSVVGEGSNPLNIGGPNPANPFYGGTGTAWAGFTLGIYQTYFYFDCFETNGESKANELDGPHTLTAGNWVYVVCTYANSIETMYTNGVQAGGAKTIGANGKGLTYVPDLTTPLMIGSGPDVPNSFAGGGDNEFWGALAEVAIYNQALSSTQVTNHWLAATSVATYTNTVLADNPMLYFRMNDGQFPTNAGYPGASFPVATNYGTAGSGGDGVYQPGTTPGVAGPPYAGFGSPSYSVSLNGWLGSVDVGNSNLPAALNPTGTNPITEVCWFQTGPADSPARLQAMLGRNTNSFLGLGTAEGEVNFNPGAGKAQTASLDFSSAAQVDTNGFAFNDGNWHMAAGVSDGTNEYLYLDGSLALSNNISGGINLTPATSDMLLGGVPQYTAAYKYTANSIETFDGQIAQVAFWNTNLSASQIQSLFNAAGVSPYIGAEPASSTTVNQGQIVAVSTVIRGSSVAYQWFTTNGVAVAGQTNASLVFNPANATNSGSYYVVATNSYGSVTSSIVNVTIYGAPVIEEQTSTQLNIFAGSSPTLYVTTYGPTNQYQWSLNNTPITGATNSTYTLTNIQNSANYICAITNLFGSNSTTIAVTVLTDPTAPYPAQVLANGPIAYYRLDEPPNATTAYDYVGGDNGNYTNVVTGEPGYDYGQPVQSDPNETSALFGYDNPPNNYVGDFNPRPNFGVANGGNAEFSVEAWINETYFNPTVDGDCIVALGYGNGGEQFVLDDGASTTGDLRFFVRNAAGTTSSAASATTVAADGLWHHVVGVCDEAGGHVYLYLDGNLLKSGTITAGSGLLASTMPLTIGARESGNNNPFYCDFQFYGYIDDVAIYNKALTAAQVLADYNASGIPPLNVQVTPSNLNTNQGATVTFTSSNTGGTTPLAYQWFDNNGNAITGQTNTTLSLTNIQTSQSGTYSLSVTNDYGSTNVQFTLTVNQGPALISVNLQPTNVVAYANDMVTLSVVASGSQPIFYQWYQDGVGISHATNAIYTFGAVLGTNTYYCVVTNAFNYSEGAGPTYSSTGVVAALSVPIISSTNYNSKLKITFTGYNRSETLEYFPVLVQLSTNLPGFSYGGFASPTGGDLRFADYTGTRELPYELDQWDDSNGVSSFWVQVPQLSGTNTTIWAYWGNPANTTPPAYTTNGSVWEPASVLSLPGYDIVYHMKESGFPYFDSTLNYPATTGVAPSPIDGIVGNGELFDGATTYLNSGYVTNLNSAFTLSAWVNVTPLASSCQAIWASQPGGFGAAGFAFFVNYYESTNQALLFDAGTGTAGSEMSTAPDAVPYGSWHMVTATVNQTNDTLAFFVDGQSAPIVSGLPMNAGFPDNESMYVGAFTNDSLHFTGTIDEARIHAGIDDSNWIWASYMTVASNNVFSTYSTISNNITLPITLTINVSGTNVILNWNAGTLQAAPAITGPYSNVPNATPPSYTNSPSGPLKFYRVQAQY